MNFYARRVATLLFGVVVTIGLLSAQAHFDPLFQLGRIKGECLVRKHDTDTYEMGMERRAYPYGSEVRTREDGQAVLHLSPTVQLRLGARSAIVITRHGATGALRVTLAEGVLGIYSPMEDEELPLSIQTPVAVVDQLKGRAEIHLSKEGDVHRLKASTAIAEFRVAGPQFKIERMRRNSAVEIQTALDESYTGLTGVSGEFEVMIERGSEDPSLADFRAGSRAKIWRRRAALSDRLAVAVMILSGTGGSVKESFAFLEGEAAVQETIRHTETVGEDVPPAEGGNDLDSLFDSIPDAPLTAAPVESEGGETTESSDNAVDNTLWDF